MNPLKQCDANNCAGTSHNRSRHSLRPVGQADRTNSSEARPDGRWAGRVTFADDFTREHSHPDMHLASVEISGIF